MDGKQGVPKVPELNNFISFAAGILIIMIIFAIAYLILPNWCGCGLGIIMAEESEKRLVKPKEEVWVFTWRASDELMAKNPQQKPSSEYAATDVVYSEKELSFVCFKGSKRKDKIVLTRNNPDEYYLGYIFNEKEEEHDPIRLFPENKNFNGYIFTNKGEKIVATLKRQSN